MNASGARCVTQEELESLGDSHSGAIVTKSMTPEFRTGNSEPRYVGFEGGSINSMGLPQSRVSGIWETYSQFASISKTTSSRVSLGFNPMTFFKLPKKINAVKPDLLEVNLSCPNIQGKPQIGYDAEASESLLLQIRDLVSIPMGVKLPPFFDPVHHEKMAEVLDKSGVSFISVINSVGNGLVVDPYQESVVIKPKGGFGGLGGRIIKPVALANVRAFWKLLGERISIIGVGGIETGVDVFEHVLCGASAVQIGTALVEEDVGVFERLEQELGEWLNQKGYRSLSECRGTLKEM